MLCILFFSLLYLGQAWGKYPTYTSIIHCRGACGAGGACVNVPGSTSVQYYCRCNDPTFYHNGVQCLPCPVSCIGGECEVDRNGVAVCRCPAGATLINGVCDFTGGRTQCELNCIGGVCVQTPDGRWECRCAPPLVLINGQCLPCPIPCVGGRCEPDFNGGAVCVCPFDTSLVNGVCIPNRQLCEERCINGQCVLWNNIWQCRCPDGWELIIDRCVDVKGQCDRECVNGFCVRNTNTGQWECRCYPGFEFVLGRGCVQIDYCGTGPPKCENGLCFNIIGGYRCQCSPGFEPTPDGRACVPTQETICKQNCQGGTCLWDITLGQYICNCPPGFRLLNGMCTDIDECLNPTLCQNGRCVNLPGSFRCECNPGFRPTPDSMGCVEIVSPPTCQCTGGFCLLVNGIFRCVCPYGFELQGPSTCVDVNECVANPCRGGDCDNFPGGHVCLNCLPNYQLAPDGKSCIGFNPRPPPLPQPIGFPWWLLFLKDF